MTSRFDAKSFYLGSKFLWIPFWNQVFTSSFSFPKKKTLGIYWSMQQKLAEIRWLPKDMTVPTVPTQTLCNSQSSNLGVSWSCFSFKPGNGSTRVLAPKLGIFPRKSVDPHGFHCGQIGWFPIPKGPVFHQKCTMLMLEETRPTTWDV